MFYEGRVIDNSEFVSTGRIRVRIYDFAFLPKEDLSLNPNAVLDGYDRETQKSQDFMARIYTPIGAGTSYGMFYLPQVNSSGLIAMLGNPSDFSFDFVWLGGFFQMNLGTIQMPNDSLEEANGVENFNSNIENMNGALVIKLKHTELKDKTNPVDSQKTLGFQNQLPENLIVIDKDRISVVHSIIEEKNGEFNSIGTISSVYDASGGKISFNLADEDKKEYTEATLEASKDGTTISSSVSSSGKFFGSSLKTSGENLDINCVAGNDGSNILVDSKSMTLIAGGANIALTKNGKVTDINLATDGAVNLSASMVTVGTGDAYIVTSAAPLKSVSVGDGAILTTSPNARA
jgi:hypothetical protein